MRPRLALTAGDPAGIGPEIVRSVLADESLRERASLLALGPESEAPPDLVRVDEPEAWEPGAGHAWCVTQSEAGWRVGEPSRAGGEAALRALGLGARWAREGRVEGLVTAPVSKEALHAAGEEVEGQTELLHRWSGASRVEMLGCVRRLRVMLLTRHQPLLEALEELTLERVRDGLVFLDRELRRLRIEPPRLALAAMNPHASEGGLFGTQEQDVLVPAAQAARAMGVTTSDPLPADSVFVRAAAGEFDAVLALYHDQAFIPVKLHAPGEAVTLLLGLPYVRVSPSHGTAFDIAGKGRADATNLRVAVERACDFTQRAVGSSS